MSLHFQEDRGVSALARKAGCSVSTASKKLLAGKTPEQIIHEAQAWKDRQTRNNQTPADASGKDISYSEAQRLKEIALKDLRELELSVKSGDLVPVAEINAHIAGMIVESRNILIRIAPDLRDRLCLESDPAEIDKLISIEIDRALKALSEFGK